MQQKIACNLGSTTDLFTIIPGQDDDLTFDAGYYQCVPIGELVWYDVNENDVWDSWENGINGLPVNLYRLVNGSYELYDTQYTGHKPGTPSDDGYYKFCAPPGTYYVEVEMPPIGLVQTRANVINSLPLTNANEPTTDSDLTDNFGVATTASFSVLSGDMLCNIGAGFYPMATAGNRVWEDTNLDGVQDADEPAVAGVVVQAFAMSTGEQVAETATDTDGNYRIEYLRKEDYYLKFIPPAGYTFTESNQTAEDQDSDVDNSNGLFTTKAYSMAPGVFEGNIDAGLAQGILPVEWVSVDARRVDTYNAVSWSTALEVNNSHFIVERSIDQANFTAIGRVEAVQDPTSLNEYQFEDTDARAAGTYYYQIRQVDLDGQLDMSRIVSVEVETETALRVYPNPTVGTIYVDLELTVEAPVRVELFDATGRKVMTVLNEPLLAKGRLDTAVDLSALEAGVYTVRVVVGTEVQNRSVILIK